MAFARDARVRIVEGRYKEQLGSVVDLVALEPRPRYRVRTDRGRETDRWESWLHAADPR